MLNLHHLRANRKSSITIIIKWKLYFTNHKNRQNGKIGQQKVNQKVILQNIKVKKWHEKSRRKSNKKQKSCSPMALYEIWQTKKYRMLQ